MVVVEPCRVCGFEGGNWPELLVHLYREHDAHERSEVV